MTNSTGGCRPPSLSTQSTYRTGTKPPRPDRPRPNEQAHSLLQSALVQHGKYIEHIAPLQSQMTPEGYGEQLKAFGSTEAAKAVDTAEQLSTRRREQAEQEFQQHAA